MEAKIHRLECCGYESTRATLRPRHSQFGGITTSFVSHEFQLCTETCYGYPSMLNIFLPQRCNVIPTELQKTSSYKDTDWRRQHVSRNPSQHFLYVFVMADLVLGEREQVPHQPHSGRLNLVCADTQPGPGDPLQCGGGGQHWGGSRSQE